MYSLSNSDNLKENPTLSMGQFGGYQTLREKILNIIRDAICNGALKPGEKVLEPELAKQFGISRTPIREAFRQLQSEGYLKVVPRKGVVVAELSRRDIEEFYAIRSILEGYAAKLATPRLTDEDLGKLEALCGELQQLADLADVEGFFEVRGEFHETVVKASENYRLFELIQQLETKFSRLRCSALLVDGRMAVSASQYELLVSVFKQKNPVLAEILAKQLIAACGEALIKKNFS